MHLVHLVLGIVIGCIAMYAYRKMHSPVDSRSDHEPKPDQALIARQTQEKEGNLKQVRALLEHSAEITNNDVERELGVSDATATRYLSELEARGEIRQSESGGRSVSYKKA